MILSFHDGIDTSIRLAFISSIVAVLDFTKQSYEVPKSEGLGNVCVRLELPEDSTVERRAIQRPITFRTKILPAGT